MNALEAKKWLKSVIRQRLYLLKNNRSHRNRLLLVNACQRLTNMLSAYPFEGDKIFGFIRLHYTDILIIIPGNKAEDHNLKILKELALWNQQPTSSPSRNPTQSCTQLSLFS